MKKLLQLTLMALCFCAFTNKATAQYSGGTGTSADPYLIKTATDLVDLAHAVNMQANNYSGKFFRLDNDIDCGEPGFFYFPIGREATKPFKGTFNGNNNKILNLSMDMTPQPQNNHVGFFGYIDGATIENLGLVNIDIKGTDRVGAITGYAVNSEISNCYSTGKVSGEIAVGGIAGGAEGGEITNCYSTGNVSGVRFVGGIAGGDEACEITNCYFTGEVSGAQYVGSIAGFAGGCEITNCYSTGNASGVQYVGGIAGYVYESQITDCHSTATVSGEWGVGGIAGIAETNSMVSKCYFTGEVNGYNWDAAGIVGGVWDNSNVSNCYSTGTVNGTWGVGGIAGYVDGSITNCYSTGIINGEDCVGGIVGVGKPNNISVSNCYTICEVKGSRWVGGIAGAIDDGFKKGITGLEITNCAALNPSVKGNEHVGRVAGYLNSASTLTNNIAFEGMLNKNGDTNWDNIGDDDLDGANISKEDINADGTLDNRFTSPVWTTASGKLPGLFGNTVEMPEHLRIGEGIDKWRVESGEWRVYPNPTTGELTIKNEELREGNATITIYDMMGNLVYEKHLLILNSQFLIELNVSHLPAGIYFLKAGNRIAKFIKN